MIALDGRDHTGVDPGSLGNSANAKVPIRAPGSDSSGPVIGEVSAGILEGQVSDQLLRELPTLLLYFACALAIGVVASLLLARRLKRSTFGLELEEIAALVQEREAMLHGIREGVIALDRDGRVTLINDEARRLIPLDGDPVGRPISEVVSHRRLCDLLTGALGGSDTVVVTDDHILMVNRMPVFRQGRDLGAVITLRDRTELEGLLRELDSVDALTDALRAQQHEFANRMHTVAGLIELGDQQAAVRYALETSDKPLAGPRPSASASRRRRSLRCCWPRPRSRPSAACSSCCPTTPVWRRPRSRGTWCFRSSATSSTTQSTPPRLHRAGDRDSAADHLRGGDQD